MSDEEKALTLFHWLRRVIYHGDSPLRYAMVNVFGHGSCLRQTAPLAMLLGRLGYRCRNWTRHGHHLMEVLILRVGR